MTTERDELLRYYEEELSHLRSMGAEFGRKYPKIAERLELGTDHCADPYVERLIESFSYLAARINFNINRQFAEIPAALLNILYPHYITPVPSVGIALFEVDPSQGKLTSGFEIPKHTPLYAQSHQGHSYRFRTCYPITLWPVDVTYAGVENSDQLEPVDLPRDAACALRIHIECRGSSLQELELGKLRFAINADPSLAHTIYEMIFSQVVSIGLLPEGSSQPIFLPATAITPVGFTPNEEILPYALQAHPQYRLLQEYFNFPEKFLFFDIEGLERHNSTTSFDILLFFDRLPKNRLMVSSETFRLGCTPIVNLFRKTTEPIRVSQLQSEYPLVADKRREKTTEIHSILSVSYSSSAEDDATVVEPFYSFNHQSEQRGSRTYWYARRLASRHEDMPGTTMTLSLVDLDFQPTMPSQKTVFAHTLCTNRHSANQLPAGAQLQAEEAAPVTQISCLTKPSRQFDPPNPGSAYWRLVSQLSLNYLSLSDGENSLKALREIMELYTFVEDPSRQQQIAGLVKMETRKVVRRLGSDAWRGFCQGTEISLLFDDTKYVGSSAFLMASVLNHFFALYTSINSFTQLNARSVQRDRKWKQWPPMVGEQMVL